ncbi:MAG: hypothetical protein RML14_11885 [Meiothermus sp.]|uniref:hypothetical protein n=1 Tax=Meiothermus sp. TaxID=1955249 RepID=UPI00298EDE31|nr:hypothetical protein [Meiothermus sp.]MDW8482537.1 hypothetical protein [Meiothermus sp.]
MRRVVLASLLGAWMGWLLASCAAPPREGALELEIRAPAGLRPRVVVRGPGLERRVEESGRVRLGGLAPGDYSVSAEAVDGEDGHLYRAALSLEGAAVASGSVRSSLSAGETRRVGVEYRVATGRLRLEVVVSPALAGFAPQVEVRGPGGYAERVGGGVLRLEPGLYTLTPSLPPQGYTLSLSSSQVEVRAGQEVEARVAYARGFGTLWVEVAPPGGVEGFAAGAELYGADGGLLRRLDASERLRLPAGVYTLVARPVAAGGVVWAPMAERQSAVVPADGEARLSLGYQATQAALGVSVVGVGAGDEVRVRLEPGALLQSRVGPGPLRFEGLAFGEYTLRAQAVRPGVWAERYWEGEARVQASPASPLPSLDLSGWTERAGSGRIWVAGNGSFSNGGRGGTSTGELNAVYYLEDGAAGFSTFIAPTPLQGPFRIAFDREGSLYVLHQYVAGSPARIVRVSQANLRAGRISEGEPGNTVIEGEVWGWPAGVAPGPHMEVWGNEPADMAFDARGNLWVVNDVLGLIACVRASDLRSGAARIREAGARIWGPGTGLYRYVLSTPGQNGDNRPFLIPHALAFDLEGNLWFTSGGYQGPRPGEGSPVKRAFLNRLHAARLSYAANGDCNGGDVGLGEAELAQWVDVRLDVSLAESDAGPVAKPVALALEPGGGALWVGDFGGNAGGSGDLYRDANAAPETLLRVPLAGENLRPGAAWRPAWVSHRLTVGVGSGLDRGLQQVFGLAFDRAGYLWVASNNNVEVLPSDTGEAALARTDRRGRLYRLDVRGYRMSAVYTQTLDLRGAAQVFSVPTEGVGLVGVAVNLPNPEALPFVRP